MDNQQPDLVTQVAAGVARHALTGVAGALVTDGVIQSDQTAVIVGAGMALLGVAWSWWQKVGQAKVLAFVTSELTQLRGAFGHQQAKRSTIEKLAQEP